MGVKNILSMVLLSAMMASSVFAATHVWNSDVAPTGVTDGDVIEIAAGATVPNYLLCFLGIGSGGVDIPADAEITVTSTGEIDNADNVIIFNIAESAKVIWKAKLSGTFYDNSQDGRNMGGVVNIIGNGEFEVAQDGSITAAAAGGNRAVYLHAEYGFSGGQATYSGATMKVSGGLIKASNANGIAILTGKSDISLGAASEVNGLDVSINGGIVEVENSDKYAIRSLGDFEMSGGEVKFSGGDYGAPAINIVSDATINGDAKITASGSAYGAVSVNRYSVSEDRDITVSVGGSASIISSGYAIENGNGDVNISGDAKISNTDASDVYEDYLIFCKTAVINDNALLESSKQTINAEVKVEINGGTVKSENAGAIYLASGNEPEVGVFINGGTVISPDMTISSTGNVVISGGHIKSTNSDTKTVSIEGETKFEMTGGLIEAAGYGATAVEASNFGGKVLVSGGVILATGSKSKAVYCPLGVDYINEVSITGGTIFANVEVYELTEIDGQPLPYPVPVRNGSAVSSGDERTNVALSEESVVFEFNEKDNSIINIYGEVATRIEEDGVYYKTGEEWIFIALEGISDGTPIKYFASSRKVTAAGFAGIRNGEINLNLKTGNYTAELYNLQGRLVARANITAINGLNSAGIKINNLGRGLFVLNVKQAGISVIKQKITIKR